MPHTEFWVSVAGTEISRTLAPILISMTITDTDGGEADSLEIEVDDAGGQISLPPTDAPIEAGMVRVEDGGSEVGPPKMFSGRVDKVTSNVARGGGMTLTISAKSVAQKGKPKERQHSHHDKGKLSAVAKKFGQAAGLEVTVAPGIDIERGWWGMQGESFLEWGMRVAQEANATFKVRGGKAVFAERSAGQSSGGQGLSAVRATRAYGPDGARTGNLISGQLSPSEDRHSWQKFEARYYDPKDAKYKTQDFEARRRPGSVVHRDRFTRNSGRASSRPSLTSCRARAPGRRRRAARMDAEGLHHEARLQGHAWILSPPRLTPLSRARRSCFRHHPQACTAGEDRPGRRIARSPRAVFVR